MRYYIHQHRTRYRTHILAKIEREKPNFTVVCIPYRANGEFSRVIRCLLLAVSSATRLDETNRHI